MGMCSLYGARGRAPGGAAAAARGAPNAAPPPPPRALAVEPVGVPWPSLLHAQPLGRPPPLQLGAARGAQGGGRPAAPARA
ncbi:Protein of unknown function, partial [Gryllus bimaculatus]